MRFVDLETYSKVKKQLDLRMSIFASAVAGILFFLFTVGINFGAGLMTGIITFVVLFGMVYGLLRMTSNSADKRRHKVEVEIPYLDVMYMGELGILIFADDAVVYRPLNAMPRYGEFQMVINEDLFMAIGETKRRALDKYRYGDMVRCHVTLREMPHGMVRSFVFFNINNCIDAVEQRMNQICQFNAAKYQ